MLEPPWIIPVATSGKPTILPLGGAREGYESRLRGVKCRFGHGPQLCAFRPVYTCAAPIYDVPPESLDIAGVWCSLDDTLGFLLQCVNFQWL